MLWRSLLEAQLIPLRLLRFRDVASPELLPQRDGNFACMVSARGLQPGMSSRVSVQ
jgi:hypothetical protein